MVSGGDLIMPKKIRVLQVEKDAHYRQEIADHFGRLDDFIYFGLDTADQLLTKIGEYRPQLIFLATDMPPYGAFPLLKKIRTRWQKDSLAVVLFSTQDYPDSFVAKAGELGADYFIIRPINVVILEQRIRQVVDSQLAIGNDSAPSFREVKEICINFFDAMGVPPQYKGYQYLIQGIWLAIVYPDWLGAMTRKLYPAIGQHYGATTTQVERAMRYALDVTWEKGNLDELYRLFPYEIRENKGKPTNSMFIAKMADLVTFELG